MPSVEGVQTALERKDNSEQSVDGGKAAVNPEQDQEFQHKIAVLEREKERLVTRQRQERDALQSKQENRRQEKALSRQLQLRKGLSGLWDRVTGTRSKQLEAIRAELEADKTHANLEKLKLSSRHLSEIRVIQSRMDRLKARFEAGLQINHAEIAQDFTSSRSSDAFKDKALIKRIRREPVHILSVITDTVCREPV